MFIRKNLRVLLKTDFEPVFKELGSSHFVPTSKKLNPLKSQQLFLDP